MYGAWPWAVASPVPSASRVAAAHAPQKFLTPRGGGAFASLGVSQILPLHDGVLTAGGDGIVRCFRLTEPAVSRAR